MGASPSFPLFDAARRREKPASTFSRAPLMSRRIAARFPAALLAPESLVH